MNVQLKMCMAQNVWDELCWYFWKHSEDCMTYFSWLICGFSWRQGFVFLGHLGAVETSRGTKKARLVTSWQRNQHVTYRVKLWFPLKRFSRNLIYTSPMFTLLAPFWSPHTWGTYESLWTLNAPLFSTAGCSLQLSATLNWLNQKWKTPCIN